MGFKQMAVDVLGRRRRVCWKLIAAAAVLFVACSVTWQQHSFLRIGCSKPKSSFGPFAGRAKASSLAAAAEDPTGVSSTPHLRVKRDTSIARLGGTMKMRIMEHGEVVVDCIGADVVNSAMKAVITANRFMQQENLCPGKMLGVIPTFQTMQIAGETMEILTLTAKPLVKSPADGESVWTARDKDKEPQMAGRVKEVILEYGAARIHAMGAKKVNTAMKSILTATRYLRTQQEMPDLMVAAFPELEQLVNKANGEPMQEMVLTAECISD